jgi:GTP-binding protein HflX
MGRRKKASLPMATLVGYTNAGKSTLFNTLTDAAVEARDQLFSTLDPVTRRIMLPSGGPMLLTDTVGFIHKLSPAVVAAFRATLEELADSDVLLHVIDITHPKAPEQTEVVDATLAELGLSQKPRVLVINKMDLLAEDEDGYESAVLSQPPGSATYPSVFVSAAKGWNLKRLLQEVEACLLELDGPYTVTRTTVEE